MVHHIMLYECRDDFPRQVLNYSGDCNGPNVPPAIDECGGFSAIAAWSIGGKVSKAWHERCNAK